MRAITKAIFCAILLHSGLCFDIQQADNDHTEKPEDAARGRRDVIEEEKFRNIRTDNRQDAMKQHIPWVPGLLPPEDPTTKISTHEISSYQTTESVTDKPTGRGARASNENWIKLPFPNRDDVHDILTPPQPSGELINSRMPRVNFVTQNKAIEASESRNDKESIQRPTRTDDLRTEFVRPEEDVQYKPVYPRQAVYYPEDNRRPYYDDRYYPADDLYRRDTYYDLYDRKRYNSGPRVDRYDEAYDNYVPRKPKRIIYYAHLPEVVRTPQSSDLRYRYSVDPYRRYDDEYSARTGRYDYRFRPRYPYAPLRKDDRKYGYRDLASSSTSNKDKKVEEKVTPTPVLPQKEDKFKMNTPPNRSSNRNTINSHQYHDTADSYNDLTHKAFLDQKNPNDSYLRFDEPLFHSAIDDPYQRKY
ncbi:uncharacterized protein LOC112046378 [Bicyclus anynana]|uniref:Uncharacterized protein LOC112046378 n=1 Tax=Bicyclus anynana TaxID=110368 RepID=A0A6J1N705_BICAN|nr:uncharacterized protein LOC112046378 [Bicyclus anynana]XP_052742385.1 uncharacterized protein LOC112046378 [Bicyclus anynana]